MPEIVKFTLNDDSADLFYALSVGFKGIVSTKKVIAPILFRGKIFFASDSSYLIYDPKIKWLPKTQEPYFVSTTQKGRDKFDFNMADQLMIQETITIAGEKLSIKQVDIQNLIRIISADSNTPTPLSHSIAFDLVHRIVNCYQKMNKDISVNFIMKPTGNHSPIRIYKTNDGLLTHIGGVMPIILND